MISNVCNGVAFPDPVFQVKSKMFDYPQLLVGKWYYWDETGLLGDGPYATEQDARDALTRYCGSL